MGQPVLDRFNASLDFAKIHILCHNKAIGSCQQKNAFSLKNIQASPVSFPASSFSFSFGAAGRLHRFRRFPLLKSIPSSSTASSQAAISLRPVSANGN
jgi:hypothetical protein